MRNTMPIKKVRRPELYIGFSSFPLGGDKKVTLSESGTSFLQSRIIQPEVRLPSRLTADEAQRVIDYNMALESGQSEWRKARARRRLPAMLRGLLYE